MTNNKNNIYHLLQNSFPFPFWIDSEKFGRGANSPSFLENLRRKISSITELNFNKSSLI